MHLAFDIFTGIGVAAAVGIRPFLPALLVGLLAAGNVQIHFARTDYSFLQGAPFLLVMALLAVVLIVVERRVARDRLDRGAGAIALAAVSSVLGALLFAGTLGKNHYAAWPGWIGGVVAAVIAIAAIQPLLRRVRGRLEREVATWLPAYAEVVAIVVAGLSVVAPPVGVVALALLLWLLIAARGRDEQKYAGLRILR